MGGTEPLRPRETYSNCWCYFSQNWNHICEMIAQMIWGQILPNKGRMTKIHPWTLIWT